VLCSRDLVQTSISFKALNNLIHGICSFFSRSPKKVEILLKEEIALNEEQLKLIMPLDERWLSHYPAVKRIITVYSSLISALHELMEEYPIAKGYLLHLTRFRIIGLLHAFADLLHVLNALCQVLQKRCLRFDDLLLGIASTRAGLEGIISKQNCVYFDKFLANFDPLDKILYKETKLMYDEDMEKDISHIRATILEACNIVKVNLDRRFSNLQLFEQLRVFEPRVIRGVSQENLNELGVKEIKMLVTSFNRHYLNPEAYLDSDATLADWSTAKHLIRGDWAHLEDEKIESTLIKHPTLLGIAKIYEYISVIPLTTVECERQFSRMNLIKTTLRNQLEPDTLGALMNISMNGPGIENFDFRKLLMRGKKRNQDSTYDLLNRIENNILHRSTLQLPSKMLGMLDVMNILYSLVFACLMSSLKIIIKISTLECNIDLPIDT
jgi:hypothetical protein